MIKVEGHSEYVRDPASGAILLVSTPTVEAAIRKNRENRQMSARVNNLEQKVDKLTSMMEQLLEKLNG